MCMLTAFPMPDLLDKKTVTRLENGADLNTDGHGWAVISEGRILVGKDMKAENAIDTFIQAYATATGPAIFHSRFTTHGGMNLANVHPFPVRKMANTFVAHNGIMPTDAHPEKWDPRSDTRVFADDILAQRFGRLDRAGVRTALAKYLGGNKIAVLTTNRKLRRNLYLSGMEMGEWVGGVWYSNGDHEGYGRYGVHYGSTSLTSDGFGRAAVLDADDDCLWCHGSNVVNRLGVCEVCGTCQDCFEPYRECSCSEFDIARYQKNDDPDLPDADQLPGLTDNLDLIAEANAYDQIERQRRADAAADVLNLG